MTHGKVAVVADDVLKRHTVKNAEIGTLITIFFCGALRFGVNVEAAGDAVMAFAGRSQI